MANWPSRHGQLADPALGARFLRLRAHSVVVPTPGARRPARSATAKRPERALARIPRRTARSAGRAERHSDLSDLPDGQLAVGPAAKWPFRSLACIPRVPG